MEHTDISGVGPDQTIADHRRSFLKRSALLFGAGAVAASALKAQTSPAMSDLNILNYALTLEHLEAAFYVEGLTRYSAADFTAASFASTFGSGVTANLYSYLQAIRDHEVTHVATLRTVIQNLGGTPVTACTYNFGYRTVNEFINVAALLENTGVMAYDGAIALISNRELQTAGATIATVEARHASYLNLLSGASPFPAAFDMPRTMEQILAAAGPFITSCTTPPGGATTTAILLPKGITTISQLVQLDATTSIAGNGQPLTYSLRQIGGNPVGIRNGDTARPTVQFVIFGTYTFELTVTDSAGNTARDTATISYAGG